MSRTKLRDRKLPDYTRGEEIANMVTHIIGGVFGIVALVLCVVFSGIRHDAYRVVGSALYGASLITLYTISSVYHGLRPNMGKKVMQVIDHCSIYLLIAGTYMPILFGPIREQSLALCWTLFGIVLGFSALGCTFTAIDLNKYGKLSMICYLGIGWVIIFFFKQLYAAVTFGGLLFLLIGGVVYSIGAILYKIGSTKRYIHSVFHVFVLIGTMFHFFTVFIYCILR